MRELKSDDRPDLYAGIPPLEALKAIISIAANNKEMFSLMHFDVSRAYFHAKAQRPVLIRRPLEDRMGTDAAKVGLMGISIGTQFDNMFHHKENRVSGLTHGDDFVLTGPTKKLMEFDRKKTSVYPIQA